MMSIRIFLVYVVFMVLYQQGTSQDIDFTNKAYPNPDRPYEGVETPTRAPTGNRRVFLPPTEPFPRFTRFNPRGPVARPDFGAQPSDDDMAIETLSNGRVKCGSYICPTGSAGCHLKVATSPNGREIIRTSTCLSPNEQVITVDEKRSINPNPSATFSRSSYQLGSHHNQLQPHFDNHHFNDY